MGDAAKATLLDFLVEQGAQATPAERVAEKVDVWDLAANVQLNTTRSHTPRVTDVEALDDGTFEVTLAAIHWRNPQDVRDTKRAVVDEDGTFLRAAGAPSVDEVSARIDVYAIAEAVELTWNRSYVPMLADVSARSDGFFDARLDAAHFLNRSVIDSARVVVDANGVFQPAIAPRLTATRLEELKVAFGRERGNLHFVPNGYPPAGARFERVLLERQPGFDTYTFTALIPVGALAPGARAADPNEADSIWIERSGGFAGMTSFAGPMDV